MSGDFWERNARQWVQLMETHAIASRSITSPAILREITERKPGSLNLIQTARARRPGRFDHLPYRNLGGGAWARVFRSAGLYMDDVVEPASDVGPASIIFALKKHR